MAVLSYMFRRGGVYWFRKKLPLSLAGRDAPPHVRRAFPQLVNSKTGRFKIEVTCSLKTKDPAAAKRLDVRRAGEALTAIEGAERLLRADPRETVLAELPPIDEIEREHYRAVLTADEEERTAGDPKHGLQSEADRAAIRFAHPGRKAHPDEGLGPLGPTGWMSEEHHLAYGEWLEEELGDLRKALARRDPSILAGDARVLFHRFGMQYDPDIQHHREVALALLRASVKANEAKLSRQRGDDVPTPTAPPSGKGPKLSDAYAHWKAGSAVKGGRKRAPNTLREADAAVRMFTELHGDRRVGAISKEDARSFRNALEQKPTRLSAKQRAMTLPALLKSDLSGLPPVHGNTVNKSLAILAGIVAHAESEGMLDDVPSFISPFKGVRSAVDPRKEENRKGFGTDDLKTIFGTPVYAAGDRPKGGGGEAAFWLPVIALLTGARLEELAGLRVCDLARDPDTDAWFLDIGTSGGRSVKTASSKRSVPVHPELVRIGLIRYRETRAKHGPEATLWPDLQSKVGGKLSAAWSKWFGRYLRNVAKVTDPAKVFHSFRHSFKRLARDAGLSEEMHDALTGHAGGGGVGRGYGKGFGLKALAEGVSNIDAPALVAALSWTSKVGRGGGEMVSPDGPNTQEKYTSANGRHLRAKQKRPPARNC